jgi:hypothetical protein
MVSLLKRITLKCNLALITIKNLTLWPLRIDSNAVLKIKIGSGLLREKMSLIQNLMQELRCMLRIILLLDLIKFKYQII